MLYLSRQPCEQSDKNWSIYENVWNNEKELSENQAEQQICSKTKLTIVLRKKPTVLLSWL